MGFYATCTTMVQINESIYIYVFFSLLPHLSPLLLLYFPSHVVDLSLLALGFPSLHVSPFIFSSKSPPPRPLSPALKPDYAPVIPSSTPSLHPSAPLGSDPTATENLRLQWSFPPRAPSPPLSALRHNTSPAPIPSPLFWEDAHAGSRSQIISSTLSAAKQLLLLLLLLLPATARCSSLSGPSAVITSRHTVGVLALPVHPHMSTCCCCSTVSLSAEELSFPTAGASPWSW